RNVNETLSSLVASRIVTAYEHGNERRYHLDRVLWAQFLRFQQNSWPAYRDWPRLLRALRQLFRWLHKSSLEELTPYMLASHARTLMGQLESDLALAGVPPSGTPEREGEGYWETFTDRIER